MTDDRDDTSMEIPEADAQEQARSVTDEEELDPLDPDAIEVPEADALEQRQPVPDDD